MLNAGAIESLPASLGAANNFSKLGQEPMKIQQPRPIDLQKIEITAKMATDMACRLGEIVDVESAAFEPTALGRIALESALVILDGSQNRQSPIICTRSQPK